MANRNTNNKCLNFYDGCHNNSFSVLVTGADGFIGKALCSEMILRGFKVRASVRSNKKINNISEKIQITKTGLVGPDTEWIDALDNIESVVHLAGMVHLPPDSSREQFYKYQLVNTEGTEKLARSAAISGAKRFVFVSTIKVNGEGKADSYNEKDIPDPKDPYGVSKWEAEKRLKTVSCETGLDVVIIRSPLVYGPGVKANFLKLMKMVDREIPMPFQGVINRRSFIYIYNLTDLIIECLKHPKAAGKTYLVSDGEDVSTTDLLKYIAASLGRNSRLFYCPLSIIRFIGKITGYSEEIKKLTESLTVDSSLVRKELDWTPPFDLIQGLKETADWYKKEFHTK